MSRYIDYDAIDYRNDRLHDKSEEFLNGVIYMAQRIEDAPSIDIVRCKECIYYDPPHVDDKGKRIEYKDLPEEAFDTLGTGLVSMSYGVNIGGRCCVDYDCGYAEDKRVFRAEDNFCGKGRKELYTSERSSE